MWCIILCAILTVTYCIILCYRMGCVLLWIHFTMLHSFQSNFRSVLTVLKVTQAHESSLPCHWYGFFFHAMSDIRLQYLGPLSVLYSNGLARYPSPWHCLWPRYLPSRICLRPRLVLVLQTPLLRGSTLVLRSEGQVRHLFPSTFLVGCFSGGVVVMGLKNFWFVLRATARQTLAHYLVGSRIVLGLHYRCVTGVPLRHRGREVEVRHLSPSTLFSVGC